MGTALEAAKLLCWNACRAEDERLPESYTKAFIAKYFTSSAAVEAAADAVQIRGAVAAMSRRQRLVTIAMPGLWKSLKEPPKSMK